MNSSILDVWLGSEYTSVDTLIMFLWDVLRLLEIQRGNYWESDRIFSPEWGKVHEGKFIIQDDSYGLLDQIHSIVQLIQRESDTYRQDFLHWQVYLNESLKQIFSMPKLH